MNKAEELLAREVRSYGYGLKKIVELTTKEELALYAIPFVTRDQIPCDVLVCTSDELQSMTYGRLEEIVSNAIRQVEHSESLPYQR